MSEDKEAQEDELLALASIYDEEEFHRAESAQGGEIQLCLELPPDFKVVVKGTAVRRLCKERKASCGEKSDRFHNNKALFRMRWRRWANPNPLYLNIILLRSSRFLKEMAMGIW